MKQLFFLCALGYLGAACSTNKTEMAEMPLYEGPTMEIKDVVTLFSDSARVRIRLEAKTRLEFENGDSEFPDGVYIEFYEKDGAKTSTLKADRGEHDAKTNIYRGEGNVVVVSLVNRDELNTEELFWDPMKEKIYTEKFVTIKSEDDVHTGVGMTASQDFSMYEITQPTGTITIEDPI